ncbi:MAG: transposase [Planctomycetes bacterium]|nr:transposase [Planctomycetota bacterium]
MERPMWHVIGRGVRRLQIFDTPEDYKSYLEILSRAAEKHGCGILAYALLPNHYHLLLAGEEAALSKCMHATNRPYSRRHNQDHDLKGHTFEGLFGRYPQRSPFWAVRTSAYIHLNPVAAGLVKAPDKYTWSSCAAYLGRGSSWPGMNPAEVLEALDPNPQKARVEYRKLLSAGAASALPSGEPTADKVWGQQAQWLLEAVRSTAPSLPHVNPDVLAVLIGRHAGIPMKTLAKVCHQHDPNTAHVLAYRLRDRLSRDRAVSGPVREWAAAAGLALP